MVERHSAGDPPEQGSTFYHLFAENDDSEYVAYVSEQNLEFDDSDRPMRHAQVDALFDKDGVGHYRPKAAFRH